MDRYLGFVCAGLVLSAAAGCSGATSGPPVNPGTGSTTPTQVASASTLLKTGIYVDSDATSAIYAFRSNYKGGHGPGCTIYTGYVNTSDVAVDTSGNLVVPEDYPVSSVTVYGGPNMCGHEIGKFGDTYGEAEDVATSDAIHGRLVIANYNSASSSAGNLAVCSLKAGCTSELTNSNVTGAGAGVAIAKNGDCWLSSESAGSDGAALTYWPKCSGPGEATSGFQDASFGGLTIDSEGHLLSIDTIGGGGGQLWVYSGCNPVCVVAGGPFPLLGNPLFGKLDAHGDTFGVIETGLPNAGQVDIYSYGAKGLTYRYGFNSSFAIVSVPIGFAYNPPLIPRK